MQSSSSKIELLVQRTLEGDTSALKCLYDSYAKDMFNIGIRMMGNREDAEDVMQESFVTAFANLKKLKVHNTFGVWLRKIVINNCLQLSKTRIKADELSANYEMADTTEIDWMEVVALEKVHLAIKNLPEGCRQIFLLYASEQYTHKEIAAALQISESTSKSQYLRAKKLLQQQLKYHIWTT